MCLRACDHSGCQQIMQRSWLTRMPGCAASPRRSPRVTAASTGRGSAAADAGASSPPPTASSCGEYRISVYTTRCAACRATKRYASSSITSSFPRTAGVNVRKHSSIARSERSPPAAVHSFV